MPHAFVSLLLSAGIVCIAILILTLLLSLIRRIGGDAGLSAALCRAPLLDLIVASMTWLPWVVCGVIFSWIGVLGSLIGQFIALGVWCMAHELAHREAARGPRIVKFINRSAGRWQNHVALWVTLVALPGFWMIRFVEMFAYWPLVVLLKFPKYNQAEWVNVSRHKFEGLVGHDLIWCLYCDWMTGVYSLGAEMLRNVESFWCPIRFYDGKKCENCKVDFPDITGGWVEPGKTMSDVATVMEQQYGEGRREWFGHPARLTVNGKPLHSSGAELGAESNEHLPM